MAAAGAARFGEGDEFETRFLKRTGRVWPAIGAGVAFALLVLGTHPQWTFYAGVFVAAWTVPAERTRRNLLRWLLSGAGVVAVAMLLCAVQLLPTLEASRYSARTGGVEASGSLSLALPTFLGLIGPSLALNSPQSWEVRGLISACWLAAALAAPKLVGGRAKWQLGVLLALVFFSLGGAVLVEWLPGFNVFRVPGRMLLIAAFPLAFLAGATTDALIRANWEAGSARVVRRYLGLVAATLVLPAFVAAMVGWWNSSANEPWLPGLLGWIGIVVAILAIARRGRLSFALWMLALGVELLGSTILLIETRPQYELFPTTELVRYLSDRAKPGEARVLDFDSDKQAPLGIGAPLALTHRIDAVRGFNPLDVRHFRDYLGFVTDDPGPLAGNSPFTQQVVPNFEVANREMLNAMNVRYLARTTGSVENAGAFPRAFVVPEAAAMPIGRELEALKANDFRRTVLLTTDKPLTANGAGPWRAARFMEYRPNRAAVDLEGGESGFLVLADVWFPGWRCRVDGVEVPIHRANHAFRAVAIPRGAKEAVFVFEPRSYRFGWWVSAASLGALVLAFSPPLVAGLVRRLRVT